MYRRKERLVARACASARQPGVVLSAIDEGWVGSEARYFCWYEELYTTYRICSSGDGRPGLNESFSTHTFRG